MKRFSDFWQSIDTDEIKTSAEITMEEMKLNPEQKECISAMCFGMIGEILQEYHQWASSKE